MSVDESVTPETGVDDSSAPDVALTSSRKTGAAREHAAAADGQSAPSPTRSTRRLDGEKACAPDVAAQVFVSAEALKRSGHADGVDEPAGQKTRAPAAQATQVAMDVAPTVLEYVPAGHSAQEATEVPLAELEYVPAGHSTGAGEPAGQ